jgi:hypothetical protein
MIMKKHLLGGLAVALIALAGPCGVAVAQTAPNAIGSSHAKSVHKRAHLKKVDNMERDGGTSGGVKRGATRGNPYDPVAR